MREMIRRSRRVWSPIDYGTHYGVPLTEGKITLIDKEDLDKIRDRAWTFDKGYAQNHAYQKTKLHRIVMGLEVGDQRQVDHINHDKLDNRKQNLRICSRVGNAQNRKLNKDNKSGYKGVSWYPRSNKWVAHISCNKKLIHLGYFIDPKEASDAYEAKAKELFGEYYHPL